MATWETNVHGADWIQRLVKEGRVTQLQAGGYPSRYTARAGDVLPLLAGGTPVHDGPTGSGEDVVMPGKRFGNTIIHRDKIARCPPDKVLTIDVWDKS